MNKSSVFQNPITLSMRSTYIILNKINVCFILISKVKMSKPWRSSRILREAYLHCLTAMVEGSSWSSSINRRCCRRWISWILNNLRRWAHTDPRNHRQWSTAPSWIQLRFLWISIIHQRRPTGILLTASPRRPSCNFLFPRRWTSGCWISQSAVSLTRKGRRSMSSTEEATAWALLAPPWRSHSTKVYQKLLYLRKLSCMKMRLW